MSKLYRVSSSPAIGDFYDGLSEDDQAVFDRLVVHLQIDPSVDGRTKIDYSSTRSQMLVCQDLGFMVFYRVIGETIQLLTAWKTGPDGLTPSERGDDVAGQRPRQARWSVPGRSDSCALKRPRTDHGVATRAATGRHISCHCRSLCAVVCPLWLRSQPATPVPVLHRADAGR